MRASSYILNVFITASILIVLERVFAFTGSRLLNEAWLLIAVVLFLLVSLTVFLGSFLSQVFGLLDTSRRTKWLKSLIVLVLVFVPIYFLGLQLSQGNWVKAQVWVDYFPVAIASIAALSSVIGLFLFERIQGSKHQRIFGIIGVIAAIALLYLQAKISGGVYHYVYLSTYLIGLIILTLSIALLDLKNRFKKMSYILWTTLLIGSLFVAGNIRNTVRANADLNSLTFSTLSSVLLPKQKLNFLEKVLVGNDAIVSEKIPEITAPIGNADWNVLFIVVDTLRADIFEPWRQGDITTAKDTPFMDSFFKDAVHFERGYAQASGTILSMPSLFRSLEVNEKSTKFGRPIGQRFSDDGYRTFAVVNNLFVEPRYLRTRALLDGFQDIRIYQKREQNDLLKLTRESLERYEDEKWFAWVHFYNMHHTAFDGKFLKGHPRKRAYTRAAGWLDSQMKALVEDLKARNLYSKTVIVFTADHGESFGDNGFTGHGRSIWEEEIRAPIAIRIPGVPGQKIEGTVGNIDLLPTLLELLKRPKDPALAGRSLVPYIANGVAIPDASYYLSNVERSQTAIVHGSDKLVFESKKGILQRFDLDSDPKEETDLFDAGGKKELRLRRDLVFHSPRIVKDELKTPAMRSLLLAKISALRDDDNRSSLLFAKLLTQNPDRDGMKKISEIILRKNNRYFAQHYRILCRTKYAQQIRIEMKKRLTDATTRKALLREIVDLSCPSFNQKWVRKMMESAEPIERKYWLTLSLQYSNGQKLKLLPLMNTWLEDSDLGIREERLIYRNIKRMKSIKKRPTSLSENVRNGLTKDEITAETAIYALGSLGDEDVVDTLIKLLDESESTSIKQAILMALARMKTEKALETISQKMAEDSLLTLGGAKALLVLEDERGLKFLDDYGAKHSNKRVRASIKKLAKKLRKKIAKKK